MAENKSNFWDFAREHPMMLYFIIIMPLILLPPIIKELRAPVSQTPTPPSVAPATSQ